jgi:phage tail sheath protein FI
VIFGNATKLNSQEGFPMPVAVSYPGVYIEEIPSGVRTITGVATSIAAFAGWAAKGPTDEAGVVLGWQDFYRQYGGLDPRSLLGYAVSHFLANGGQQAYVIRLVATADTAKEKAAKASLPFAGTLTVTAANEGIWANDYGIAIKNRSDPSNPVDTHRVTLSVVYVKPGGTTETIVETFENLSVSKNDPRFVEIVVNTTSSFIKVAVDPAATVPPLDTPTPSPKLAGGLDGDVLEPNDATFENALYPLPQGPGALNLLDRVDLFNLLCVPGETNTTFLGALEEFCRDPIAHRRAFLIADCPQDATFTSIKGGPGGAITGDDAINAAFYFPWVEAPDPFQQNRPNEFPPCGFVAGLYAKTDANRGVWKAPAGTEASLTGVSGVTQTLTDIENGILNKQAINCIRNFNVYGTVIWGARTLRGNDEVGSEWKYVPVRRTALFIEETLYRALKWVVFEPNDEPLWAQIRLNVGAFMQDLFRKGAFQGKTPQEAYFVKCDKETTTQNDINLGIVNILVGFAPLKPAEFVVIQIQQMAGQIAT